MSHPGSRRTVDVAEAGLGVSPLGPQQTLITKEETDPEKWGDELRVPSQTLREFTPSCALYPTSPDLLPHLKLRTLTGPN